MRFIYWSSDVCSSDLAARSHGGEEPGDVLQLSGGVVERNDARAAAERLEGVATGACSEVEEQIALAHPELIEANGEHQRACSRRMRYCSTVLAAVCFHDQRSMMRCRPRAPRSEEHTSELQSLM